MAGAEHRPNRLLELSRRDDVLAGVSEAIAALSDSGSSPRN